MKKIIAVGILLVTSVVYATIAEVQVQSIVTGMEQHEQLTRRIRGFISIYYAGFKYNSCDNSGLEPVCTDLAMTALQKQAMIAQVKALDNQLYEIELARHNLIQGF